MSKKVFIVCEQHSSPYHAMMQQGGWNISGDIWSSDLVLFIGGEDVSPELYGEKALPVTGRNIKRDQYEAMVFMATKAAGIPMAGICRGGQFLNVMCGGRMYQHVDGHLGVHEVKDVFLDRTYKVTSTHHQLMRPSDDAIICAYAELTKQRQSCSSDGTKYRTVNLNFEKFADKDKDVEIAIYPEQSCLCFQPHPEHNGQEELAKIFFEYLDVLNNQMGDK